jgi:hypothetical protein
MDSPQSRRARSSSERTTDASPATPPQRPRLGDRTISAPAGGLYKLDRPKGTADEGKTSHTTVIEEHETPLASPVENHADGLPTTSKGNNEVCPEAEDDS